MPRFFRCEFLVLLLAGAAFYISRHCVSPANLEPSLAGQVAIVTGASRGIGKGLAVGLGEAGALVYVTGRTVAKGAENDGGPNGKSQSGSLEETCEAVVKAGGKCVPVAVDNANDTQLEMLFDRVQKEQGRLDILVNNAFAAASRLPALLGKPFWEKPPSTWDLVNNVGLRSHYVASVHAAKLMTKAKRGLIVNVGSFGGMNYIFDVAYGVGKAAMDRMANDMAIELATDNVAMVALWPGLVKTENIQGTNQKDGILEGAMKERRGLAPGTPESMDFSSMLSSPLAETPLFSGRAVAALARDRQKMSVTGKVLPTATLAAAYDLIDERGIRSPPFTSVKYLLSVAARPLLEKYEMWTMPGDSFTEQLRPHNDLSAFFWRTLPDFAFPGPLAKLGSGAPNL